MQSKSFTIAVRKNGEVILRRFDGTGTMAESTVLSHVQIGLDTKPWQLDDLMADVRTAIWDAWRELLGA